MSPAHVLEPTYEAIRRRLIAGSWRPGFRLEAARLADELGVSITPVRDSLNRLTGERLVQANAGEGFQVPRIEGVDLRAMIGWHRTLIALTIPMLPSTGIAAIPHGHDGAGERASLLFGTMVAFADDVELNVALANLAARLAPYRRHEETFLPGLLAELDGLESCLKRGAKAALTIALDAYHLARLPLCDTLVQAARQS